MTTTAIFQSSWDFDQRRKCDTLRVTVSQENAAPFQVLMTGVYSGANRVPLENNLKREVVKMLAGKPHGLVDVDGVWHCPIVKL